MVQSVEKFIQKVSTYAHMLFTPWTKYAVIYIDAYVLIYSLVIFKHVI